MPADTDSLLCLDVGNTHTHYGLLKAGEVSHTGHLRTQQWAAHPQELTTLMDALGAPAVAYCSVVPAVCAVLEQTVQAAGHRCFHLSYENAPAVGLPIHYPKPSEIGEDRLANALGAQAFYGSPAIVIDMGTAVTFDIVGARGGYEGGIIAPGITVMTQYLHEQTALLPKLSEDDLLVGGSIGKSTLEAMKLGCVVGFSGMIAALLGGVLRELATDKEPPIIGTGGTARSLLKDVHPALVLDAHITLRGLAEAHRRAQEAGLT